ncbi:hypothetical protein DSO10_04555 [Listeria monocytogenes]|uniref:hypothetical protein n=1 Tax=Listeria monocytogenes TaxID=1639 RepID=UPI000F0FA2AB|nr:hypothetical protein [Listeria monocytogenes]EAD0738597.1 hypothetical protein [Listeria monocytogenes]MCN73773.1 hypothetical protein [Listeria monocytogenes]TYU88933.1 hypothetical protein FZX01_05325 [Listeria monocytogenes]
MKGNSTFDQCVQIAIEVAKTTPISFSEALTDVSSYIYQAACLGYPVVDALESYKNGVPLKVLILIK